jgi:hypothetical protein
MDVLVMNRVKLFAKQVSAVTAAARLLLSSGVRCRAASAAGSGSAPNAQDRFLALPLAKGDAAGARMLCRRSVPFIQTPWHAPASGSLLAGVGTHAKKIYLPGMTEGIRSSAWSDASSYSQRFFVGDCIGDVRLHYAGGSTQDFPLILGESVSGF